MQLEPYRTQQLAYDYEERKPIASVYPDEILELCYLVTPDSPTGLPVNLEEVLDITEQAKPELVKDRRFQHLLDLIESA